MRQDIDVVAQFGMVFEDVFGSQGLDSKRQVHDFSRMTVAGSQVDQTAFSQEVDDMAVREFIAFDVVTGFKMTDRQASNSGLLISTSKMTGIGQDDAVFSYSSCVRRG